MDKDQDAQEKKTQKELEAKAKEDVLNEIRDEEYLEVPVPNLILSTRKEHMRMRYSTVAEQLLKGYTPTEIANKYHKEWNVTIGTIQQSYVPIAREAMKEDIPTDVNDLITDIWSKYDYLYRKFGEESNWWGCKSILDAKLKMLTGAGAMDAHNELGPIKIIEIDIVRSQNGESSEETELE